jgi:hypothetical protein
MTCVSCVRLNPTQMLEKRGMDLRLWVSAAGGPWCLTVIQLVYEIGSRHSLAQEFDGLVWAR